MSTPVTIIHAKQFWFLATPYSTYLGGLGEACTMACLATAQLMRAGIAVYSPIAHGHNVAFRGGLDPYDHNIWLPANEPMMRAAYGLIVYCVKGWQHSVGIKHEMEFFRRIGRPLCSIEPHEIDPGPLSYMALSYLRAAP